MVIQSERHCNESFTSPQHLVFKNLVSVASFLALVNLGEQRGEHFLRQQGLAADSGTQLVIAYLHIAQSTQHSPEIDGHGNINWYNNF